MYTMTPDVPITRRGRLTFIFDEKEELRWSGKRLVDALVFLMAENQDTVEIDDGEHTIFLHFGLKPK